MRCVKFSAFIIAGQKFRAPRNASRSWKNEYVQELGRQTLAPLAAASSDDGPPPGSGHAFEESVRALAANDAWLIGSFHVDIPE